MRVGNLFGKASKKREGYKLYTVKTLTFDGTPQAIPVVTLHCDRHHSVTSGAGARTEPRHDWFFDVEGNCFQLLALVQLCYKLEDQVKSIYFYMASATKVVKKKLFPTVQGER